MKKPRVEDFDPNTKAPPLKSTLDNMPVIEKPTHTPLPSKPKPENKQAKKKVRLKTNHGTMIPRHHDTTTPLDQDSIAESIRKAVRHLGKEAATYRFTQEEKRALVDIVYTYKGQGIRTSENVITRIAINYLVENYKQAGRNSILARVLEMLNE